ncbi:MAG: hypothetical protein J5I59_05605 [Saprospiraceae bacterium]|nr:hypothetical protein [Saprospiraceae bacterium]
MNTTLKSKVTFYTLFIFSFFMVFLTSATLIVDTNEGQLTGKVLFSDKTPVQDVVVNVLKKDDLSLVSSEMPDTWGKYSFNNLKPGEYYISVQKMDQTQKVYGPIKIEDTLSKVKVKPITVIETAKATQAVIFANQYNSAS